MNLEKLADKLRSQNFGENDSVVLSAVNHPIKAAGKATNWLKKQIDIVESPILPDRLKAEASMNIAGLAQLGSFPFAPKSAGGTFGTVAKPRLPNTEYSKAHKAAQKNAVKMLGLPPNNTAMDRAKAMGFDMTPMYHGTSSEFPEFSLTGGGGVSRSPVGKLGVSLADNPALADEFAILAAQKAGPNTQTGANVLPLLHRIDRGASMQLDDGVLNSEVFGAIYDAQAQGIDAIKMNNYTTPSGKNLGPAYLVKNPNQLRSRFAAFDPAKKDSANILATLAGIMALREQDGAKK